MSKVKVRLANNSDLTVWNSFVRKNIGGTIFHELLWLKITAKYTNSYLWPLVGYKGSELVFVLPLFYSKKWGVKLISSPPPGGLIPYLGPVFSYTSNRRSVIENTLKQFSIQVTDFVTTKLGTSPDLMKIYFKDNIDVRPFIWNDFNIQPVYSYMIDLNDDLKNIRSLFSKSERYELSNIQKNVNVSIEKGHLEHLLLVNNLVRKRYKMQNIRYDIPDSYLKTIYREYRDQIEIYILKFKDKIVNGIVFFRSQNTLGHWIGAIHSEPNLQGGVTMLHWHGLKRAKSLGLRYYDLCGANTEHLCRYKSKLNPDLHLNFILSKSSLIGEISSTLYRKIKNI